MKAEPPLKLPEIALIGSLVFVAFSNPVRLRIRSGGKLNIAFHCCQNSSDPCWSAAIGISCTPIPKRQSGSDLSMRCAKCHASDFRRSRLSKSWFCLLFPRARCQICGVLRRVPFWARLAPPEHGPSSVEIPCTKPTTDGGTPARLSGFPSLD